VKSEDKLNGTSDKESENNIGEFIYCLSGLGIECHRLKWNVLEVKVLLSPKQVKDSDIFVFYEDMISRARKFLC
jgi:hypothetical protein